WLLCYKKERYICFDIGSNRVLSLFHEIHFHAARYLPATIAKYQKQAVHLSGKFPRDQRLKAYCSLRDLLFLRTMESLKFMCLKVYSFAYSLQLFYSIPSSSFASSLIKSWLHGGSEVISTSASFIIFIDFTLSSTSIGRLSATGQLGVVSVINIFTSRSSFMKTS